MDPIRALLIRSEETSDGYSRLEVRIDEAESLVMEGSDAGEEVRRLFGDSDFEYWLTVPAAFKDTVLLCLILDRFQSVHDLRAWLEQRSIPCEFTSYS